MEKSNLIETVETFKVKFGGQSHSVDAELFTKTINNTIDLVKASAMAIDPTSFLRLEIRANKEGSFETIIDAVAKHSQTLFTKDNISFAFIIVQGFLNFIYIKHHLKGAKAKRIETKEEITAIQNQDNEVIKVPSNIGKEFFNNPKIDNSIVFIFNDLKADNKESFIVEHGSKKVSFEMKDFSNMSQPIVDNKISTSQIEKQKPIEVDLLLKKPDLLGDSAWQFVYNKNINAKIDDLDFLNKVHNREIKTLYAGVKVPCLLQIEYELDEKFNPIKDSDKYTILKVLGDIIEPKEEKTIDLFSDEKED